jgi:hypothetical protein
LGGREDFERQRQQRVPGEDRRRLVEGAVDGRPAAAQVVVVHRRQVVVNQRIAVPAFDRRPDPPRAVALGAEGARGLDDQERPQPLAAAENGVAHRLDQPLRPRPLAVGRREADQRVEFGLDGRADFGELGGESVCLHQTGRAALTRRNRRGRRCAWSSRIRR